MRWTGNVTRIGDKGDAYRVLTGKPVGNITLGRAKHSWEDIKQILEKEH
jgi:hypothetical protein